MRPRTLAGCFHSCPQPGWQLFEAPSGWPLIWPLPTSATAAYGALVPRESFFTATAFSLLATYSYSPQTSPRQSLL